MTKQSKRAPRPSINSAPRAATFLGHDLRGRLREHDGGGHRLHLGAGRLVHRWRRHWRGGNGGRQLHRRRRGGQRDERRQRLHDRADRRLHRRRRHGAAATAFLTNDQYLAQTTAGAADFTISKTVTALTELARFYSDPVDNTTAYLLSTASVTTTWDTPPEPGAKVDYTITLNDFDTAANTSTQIATTGAQIHNNGGQFTDNFTVPANTVLKAGHRLLWIISAADSNGSKNSTQTLHINSATAAQQSFGTVCLSPVRVSLTKNANKLSVTTTGDTITTRSVINNPNSVARRRTRKVYRPDPGRHDFASSTLRRSVAVGTATATTTSVGATGNMHLDRRRLAAGASAR